MAKRQNSTGAKRRRPTKRRSSAPLHAVVRRDGLIITRDKLMRVLDRNFAEAGIRITTRRYNTILTDLGFWLD